MRIFLPEPPFPDCMLPLAAAMAGAPRTLRDAVRSEIDPFATREVGGDEEGRSADFGRRAVGAGEA